MNILEDVQQIFRDIFDDEKLVVVEKTNADEIEDWDSLAHIRLIVAIEKHFLIKFAFGELQALKNVGEMVALIEKKCK
jgi:acyl carrier protein